MFKFAALLAVVVAGGHHGHHDENEMTLGDFSEGLWGYHQKIVLRKWARFFKYADTNRTGALTWSEYWNAVHKILHSKGWTHTNIMKYKSYFYKKFRHTARGGLIRWKDVTREVAQHVKH